ELRRVALDLVDALEGLAFVWALRVGEVYGFRLLAWVELGSSCRDDLVADLDDELATGVDGSGGVLELHVLSISLEVNQLPRSFEFPFAVPGRGGLRNGDPNQDKSHQNG